MAQVRPDGSVLASPSSPVFLDAPALPPATDAVITEADMSPTQRVFVARAKPRHAIAKGEPRRYDVTHRTVYRYQKAVERSAHLFRLFPIHDRLQAVRSFRLEVSVDGQSRDFEDVFGNRVRRVMLDTAFTELVIDARSDVELFDMNPLEFRPPRGAIDDPPGVDALAAPGAAALPACLPSCPRASSSS